LIHDKICNLGEDFANNLREGYSNTIDEYNSNLSHILKKGFGMEEMQAFDLMQKCEQQSYDYSVSELKLVFKSQTNQVLLRKF
jgi:hypothetical protein